MQGLIAFGEERLEFGEDRSTAARGVGLYQRENLLPLLRERVIASLSPARHACELLWLMIPVLGSGSAAAFPHLGGKQGRRAPFQSKDQQRGCCDLMGGREGVAITAKDRLLQQLHLVEEMQRVKRLRHRPEFLLFRCGEAIREQQALEWRFGRVVHPAHRSALDVFGYQFHRWLKAVHIQAQGPVQFAQLSASHQATISDHLAYDHAIFLFYEALVPLLVGPSPCKRDLLAETIRGDFLVDELSSIVCIDPQDGKRKQCASTMQGSQHGLASTVEQGQTLHPAGGDIGQREWVEATHLQMSPAVRHQVGFHKAWLRLVPLGKGPDGNLLFEQWTGFGGRDATWVERAMGMQ